MIRLDNISKSFSTDGGEIKALQDISLTVAPGEIYGIIGSSGAGKSTLVRMINLLERPDWGEVFIDGERITEARGQDLRRIRRRIGMVFQHFNLLSTRTVAANVAYPLELAGQLDRRQIDAKVAGLLERVGLSSQARKYPAQLSGGQKQRVGIARALANDPEVLLCDEATSALDPETTRSVLDLLLDINRDLGVTIVLITHEMDVVRRTCDRVAVLDHGRLVESGRVLDVFLQPRHAATQRLVREAEHLDDLEAEPRDGGPDRIRLTLTGQAAREPVLGKIARQTGVDYQIFEGRVGRIRDVHYAQFSIRFSGGDADAAIAALTDAGVVIDRLIAEPESHHVV